MGGQMHDMGLQATAWAHGLGVAQQHEWLLDCYRMRVDDDMCWGGGQLRGAHHCTRTRLPAPSTTPPQPPLAGARRALR